MINDIDSQKKKRKKKKKENIGPTTKELLKFLWLRNATQTQTQTKRATQNCYGMSTTGNYVNLFLHKR